MMGDRHTGGQNASSEEVMQVLHELAEALTALGNYVTAATQSDSGKASGEEHRRSLAGASSEHERASVAVHRLLQLLTPRPIDPDK
jgi:hypothetical protein